MSTSQDLATKAELLEFVTVAAEYCAMLENLSEYDKERFISKMQKLLPLLYLKASLLPKVTESEEGFVQNYVSESDWMALFLGMKDLLGENNDYLEVFDKRMQDSEAPIVVSLSENFADIYQDLRDFLTNFHLGTEEVISDYWGQYTVNALRAIHHIITQEKETDDAF